MQLEIWIFIKYSLEDRSILNFIKELNNTDDGVKIKVTGKIESLHHQDYDGKRVYIQLTDKNKYSISSKLDIGVHKYFDMEQDEYYFDFYYLINNQNLDKDKLIKFIDILIFQDDTMRENELKDIHIRLTNILNNNRFQSRINTANNNWLEIPIKDVIENVLTYFDGLVKVTN